MNRIYLDNGATSFPKAPGVPEAVFHFMKDIGANVGRGAYESAIDAGMVVYETRERLKEIFNLKGKSTQVILVPGATYGINMVLKGYLKKGDHVIVSSLEHNAVMRPIVGMAEEGFITFSRIPASREGLSDLSKIEELIQENTAIVCVSHASNVCGSIFPIEEMAKICKEKNIPFVVDASQSAGHLHIDFDGLGLAALCMPGHKGLLGPQGIGVVILEENFAHTLKPLVVGGTGSASDKEIQPDFLPDKFESGTTNIPGIFGLHKALEYIIDRGIDDIRKHDMNLIKRFIDGIKDLPIRIIGGEDIDNKVGVLAVDFTGMDNAEVSLELEEEYGISTRCGLHCAPNAHKTLDTYPQGVVRFSVGYANTKEDIDTAIKAIRNIVSK
ncbi:MAG: aminotransferase class V-fold PLP-dependent enzyme [Tissierellia bacterium]|nr:aminotransferase class V-fold PLP-dependent enzyme [Tissierellia bacterium]